MVDDGSSDDGADVVRRFQDPRIRLISQPHAGVSVARNRGVSEARAPWVGFLDADDEWLPEFLEFALGAAESAPEVAGVFANYIDSTTGKPALDRSRLEGIANIYASPVAAAGRVYFTGRDGTTVVIKKGPELEILATNKLSDSFDGSMALVDSEIILRGREHLYCIAAP